MYRIFIVCLLIFGFLLSFSACRPTSKPQLNGVQKSTNICQKYPFLRAYHCSFDQVQWAARKGDAHAQYVLGYLYYYGISVLPNSKLAIKWITQAAKKGDISARNALTLLSSQKTMVSTSTANTSVRNSRPKQSKGSRRKLGASACTDNQGYTIQIAGSQNLSKLRQFAQRNHRYFETDTFVYRKTFNNAPWYVLTYGHYSTYAEARRKLNGLSPSLRSYQPWVKSCNSLMS